MLVPRWLLFLVAAWVMAFGVYRLRVATAKRERDADADPDRPNFSRKGLYARSPRSHILFGVLYLLLGGALVAMGFGWKPAIDPAGCAGDTDQHN
jgi:hypothetical protein